MKRKSIFEISKEELAETFAERVRNLRTSAGMTQQELGDIIGLSKQAINDIEKCRRLTSIYNAIRIANYFNTTVDYLSGIVDDPTLQYHDK